MGLKNINEMNFANADEWVHIERDEVDSFMEKIAR